VGNLGGVYKRVSYNNGQTWNMPEFIFKDSVDDRNVFGGITDGDRIIVTFNRYEAVSAQHLDFNLIYSDDWGQTWSAPVRINSDAACAGTAALLSLNGNGYLLPMYTNNFVELRWSSDGIAWDSVVHTWDYRITAEFKISETCFISLGNNKIMGLFRNESGIYGEGLLQVSSYDGGLTWSQPEHTNLADGMFCPSPWIWYDEVSQEIWTIATDRRGNYAMIHNHDEEELWVYRNKPGDVLSNPAGYTLVHKKARPYPNYYRFFGYPTSVKLDNGSLLVMLTESTFSYNGTEDAYFCQFTIDYQTLSAETINGSSSAGFLAPNPLTSGQDLTLTCPQFSGKTAVVTVCDITGRKISWSEAIFNQDGTILLDRQAIPQTAGLYSVRVVSGNDYDDFMLTVSE
jgi:hypothetical protein